MKKLFLLAIILSLTLFVFSCSEPYNNNSFLYACNSTSDCPDDFQCVNFASANYYVGSNYDYANPYLNNTQIPLAMGICIHNSFFDNAEITNKFEFCDNGKLDNIDFLEDHYGTDSTNLPENINSLSELADCNNPQCAFFEQCAQNTTKDYFLSQLYQPCTFRIEIFGSNSRYNFISDTCPAGIAQCIPLDKFESSEVLTASTTGQGICLPLCSGTKNGNINTIQQFDDNSTNYYQYMAEHIQIQDLFLLPQNNLDLTTNELANHLKCRKIRFKYTELKNDTKEVPVVLIEYNDTNCSSGREIHLSTYINDIQTPDNVTLCLKTADSTSTGDATK